MSHIQPISRLPQPDTQSAHHTLKAQNQLKLSKNRNHISKIEIEIQLEVNQRLGTKQQTSMCLHMGKIIEDYFKQTNRLTWGNNFSFVFSALNLLYFISCKQNRGLRGILQ
ncbi:hypothetical protein EGW08_022534 [Elysia chlorotica]|uniref:Uncharacterized protein n=1 Tax=Elysia chlorotica TaxID=188477 RepID=A0A3S1AR36_ELYCH|nr:hypothetical protein EGW08_022534 [Elysia chlorotica]